jgi:hypothetical protein
MLIVTSGIILVIGLLLIYAAPLRHPAALFAGALVMLMLILWHPDLSIALVQASLLGVVLALVACGLKWYFDLRRSQATVIPGTPYSSPDSQTVKALPAEAASESLPTTNAAAVSAVVVESDA